jgi:hypothetical protein
MLRHYYALHPHCTDAIVVRRRPTLAEAAPQRQRQQRLVMLLPPALWRCVCPCGTDPVVPVSAGACATEAAQRRPVRDRWRPAAGRTRFAGIHSRLWTERGLNSRGGGACATTSRRSSRGGFLGAWGAAGAAGGAVSESVFQGRTLASNRCAVCVVHFDDTVPFTMRSASFASSCSVYSLRMHPVA